MLKKLLTILIIVLIILPIYNCSIIEPKGEISGEVFIITKGAKNIKLGSVKIIFIPKQLVSKYITKNVINKAKKEIKENKKNINKYLNEIDSLETELEMLKYNWDLDDYEIESKKDDINSDIEIAEIGAAIYLSGYHSYMNGTYFIEKLKNNINLSECIKTQTNSDGQYNVKIYKNIKYLIIANAKRRFYGSSEKYCWLLWYSLGNKRKDRLSLKNDNLFIRNPSKNIFNLSKIDPNWMNTYYLE